MSTSSLLPGNVADPSVLNNEPWNEQPPVLQTNAIQPAPAPGSVPVRQSPWVNILQGALAGVANVQKEGRGGFGVGLAQGAQGAIAANQRSFENAATQQRLQFESAQASAELIDATTRARQEDMAAKLTQAQIDQLNAQTSAYLQDHAVKPNVAIQGATHSEISNSATGALSTLAQQNDGKIPRVATFGSPVGVGPNPDTHNVVAYSANQQPDANKRGVIDDYLLATRGLPSTDTEWQSGFGKVAPGEDVPAKGLISRSAREVGQDAKFVDAVQFRQVPAVPTQNGKVDTGAASSLQQTLQQQADNYSAQPDAKPEYAKFLQQKADAFKAVTKDTLANEAQLNSQRTLATAPSEAAAAGQKTAAELAAQYDPKTSAGRLNLQSKQQDLLDKQYSNASQRQRAMFDEGQDPTSGTTLNLSNAPNEFMVDERTGQPIPTKMLSVLKPTQQESNRADFAASTLHTLDLIDQLKQSGKLPNGPLTGLTEKGLASAGLSSGDAQEALSYISLAQSAATGAHVGGRFNGQILDKMGTLLKLNMNDSQFAGAETALRNVMQPYAQNGGRETVGQFKANLMGQNKVVNGKTYTVTGFDKNGNVVLQAGQ